MKTTIWNIIAIDEKITYLTLLKDSLFHIRLICAAITEVMGVAKIFTLKRGLDILTQHFSTNCLQNQAQSLVPITSIIAPALTNKFALR